MSYEYMTGMGQFSAISMLQQRVEASGQSNGSSTPPPSSGTVAPTPSTSTTSTKTGKLTAVLPGLPTIAKIPTLVPTTSTSISASTTNVPDTVPRTGIMWVTKDGKRYVLLTKRARDLKLAALQALRTIDGNRYAQWIIKQSFPTYSQVLDGVEIKQPVAGELLAYAGRHADAFRGGARLTEAQWQSVDKALNPAQATAFQVPKIVFPTAAAQEEAVQQAEENVNQAKAASDEANQQVSALEEQIDYLNQALADALSMGPADPSASAEVQALQGQVAALMAQLSSAQDVAADADAEVSTAEAELEEIAPWYRRYMWHMGAGVLLLAVAGGGYWWWSRSKAPTPNRLPAPRSPRHPAGF